MKPTDKPLHIFGREEIDESAIQQIHNAINLPVATAAALMPDAHHGYGLPIGGVLATKNAVIPYGVGVDIGCRMALSVYPIQPHYFNGKKDFLRKILVENTKFGMKETHAKKNNHPVLDRPEFLMLPYLKRLQGKAYDQLGTSGSGNHFVEFGTIKVKHFDQMLGLEPGEYFGLLSHSGSRGLGAQTAEHYTKVARQKCNLPKEVQHLSWLDLDSDEGKEYWLAMNLAGDYASANHEDIHKRIAKALGEKPIKKVENHHNFAWKEIYNGEEHIIHRKGATPAGKNDLGIIPGSMTSPGFIVKGKGLHESINSASHGAGRRFSRTEAKRRFTNSDIKKMLDLHDVMLIGGGLDEAPMAYKDIESVMNFQSDLVDVLASFTPRIVRMDK